LNKYAKTGWPGIASRSTIYVRNEVLFGGLSFRRSRRLRSEQVSRFLWLRTSLGRIRTKRH